MSTEKPVALKPYREVLRCHFTRERGCRVVANGDFTDEEARKLIKILEAYIEIWTEDAPSAAIIEALGGKNG